MKKSKSRILQESWGTYERNQQWIKWIKTGLKTQVEIAEMEDVSKQCVNQVWKRRDRPVLQKLLDYCRKKAGI